MLTLLICYVCLRIIVNEIFSRSGFYLFFPASSLAHSIIAAVPGLGSGVSRQSPGNNMRLLAQSSVQAEYSQAASLFKSGKFTEAISSFSLIISNLRLPLV